MPVLDTLRSGNDYYGGEFTLPDPFDPPAQGGLGVLMVVSTFNEIANDAPGSQVLARLSNTAGEDLAAAFFQTVTPLDVPTFTAVGGAGYFVNGVSFTKA